MYNYLKKEYSDEAKHYLICKHIGFKSTQWDMMNSSEKQVYLKKKLWIKSNALVNIGCYNLKCLLKLNDCCNCLLSQNCSLAH